MKIRYGHVSNSSSSSFVITVPPFPIGAIAMVVELLDRKNDSVEERDQWAITSEGDTIRCYTSMDNFDLLGYCRNVLRIPQSLITEESY